MTNHSVSCKENKETNSSTVIKENVKGEILLSEEWFSHTNQTLPTNITNNNSSMFIISGPISPKEIKNSFKDEIELAVKSSKVVSWWSNLNNGFNYP